ncbi:hypothetical protein ThrDRAFT_03390 [Frankia casuarinae]|jgi:hypothetical protein|uniref:Uncharacterized protein n=1 Tax=Frankia casuarinae (strain DSM 45818 / CECT 9043 / HFP020203 / CcI3) TaxID=106370 RepID=Q2J9V3_FRACC|nr:MULTISPECIES: hypothetical protein [Frankia]ABD11939.1 hypothetical protein Francci3_2577 [Frankia casuarinae]EYT90986.1 hypothetical protein ThrDRAFT_03390 [Frankia casuarinae]KDA41545.1 hypothetical protein BMG523Draft_03613 [Frankia sp. BMG5.23]ORT48823.1 hypothetical protein KBI5_15220 [Frankia sp. KB5]TFE25500.1 hypothetical protein E0F15_19735 [Frankia sp. B2]
MDVARRPGLGTETGPLAWDGFARVDYVDQTPGRRGRGRLQFTLLTVEQTMEADVRPGLRVAFVADDPDGPPVFIGVRTMGRRIPGDLRELLGASVVSVAEQVLAGPPRSRWARLDLRVLDALALAWAPYREQVLASHRAAAGQESTATTEPDADLPIDAADRRPRSGSWDGGLWALLAVDELRDADVDLPGAASLGMMGGNSGLGPMHATDGPQQRGDDPAEPGGASDQSAHRAEAARGRWEIPRDLAGLAGIERTLDWEIHAGEVHVVARRRPETSVGAVGGQGDFAAWPRTVEVSFDNGSGIWTPLAPHPDGTLRAQLTITVVLAQLPAVRVRVTDPDGAGP